MRHSPISAKSLLAISIATLSLSGCGGGSSVGSALGALTGTAADGYLDGATVCLDLNLNGKCDTAEPTTTTGPGGQWTLDATPDQEKNAPILVKAVAGSTTDEDTGNTVSRDYELYAPAGYKNVNPVTSLVFQQAVKQGLIAPNSQQAITSVEQDIAQKVYGSTADTSLLKDDYVKGEKDTADPTAQAKFKDAHDLAKAIAATVSGSVANTSQTVVSTDGESAVELAAYQNTLNHLSTLKAIPAGSTEQEIENRVKGLQVAITSSDAESEKPDFKGSVIDYTALPKQSDAPTQYTGFDGSGPATGLSLKEMPVTVTVNSDNSAVAQALAPLHLTQAGGNVVTAATTANTTYYWSSSAGKLIAFQPKATLLSWTTSGAATFAGALSAQVAITRITLDGKAIASTVQRYEDQDWPASSLGATTAFPANSALYMLRVYSQSPILSVLGSDATSLSCPGGASPCAPLVTQTAKTIGNVSGQLLDIGVQTDTHGSSTSILEDGTGNLYQVDNSGSSPVLIKIGTAKSVAATATTPAMTLLSLNDSSTDYKSVEWNDPRIDGEGTPALFSDAQGQHLGMYQDNGGRLYKAVLFDDNAKSAIESDLTATLK